MLFSSISPSSYPPLSVAHRAHRGWVEPVITGWKWRGSIREKFWNQGTNNETAHPTSVYAIKFYEALNATDSHPSASSSSSLSSSSGGNAQKNRVMAYSHTLVKKAALLLATKFAAFEEGVNNGAGAAVTSAEASTLSSIAAMTDGEVTAAVEALYRDPSKNRFAYPVDMWANMAVVKLPINEPHAEAAAGEATTKVTGEAAATAEATATTASSPAAGGNGAKATISPLVTRGRVTSDAITAKFVVNDKKGAVSTSTTTSTASSTSSSSSFSASSSSSTPLIPVNDVEMLTFPFGFSVSANNLMNKLFFEQKVVLPIASLNGSFVCRISANIYNSLQDYDTAANVIIAYAKDMQ